MKEIEAQQPSKVIENRRGFSFQAAGPSLERAGSERLTFIEDFASRARRPAGHRKDYKTAGFLSEAPFGRRILVFFHKFRKKAPRKNINSEKCIKALEKR